MTDVRRRVLVVDDEPAVRATLSSLLEKAGYSVESAPNGQAGLRLLQRGPVPDLIVLDLMMPVMTGFEVLAVLRKQPAWAAIPVIVLTATPGHSAEDLQVDALLKKPFDMADVQASIYVALASRRSRTTP
jgi:putative two-component system response regulator